jgi:hypothetical protein
MLLHAMNTHANGLLRTHFSCKPHIAIAEAEYVVINLLISFLLDL